jgi:pimeloyl-ACP methyl ester carboxylesterase
MQKTFIPWYICLILIWISSCSNSQSEIIQKPKDLSEWNYKDQSSHSVIDENQQVIIDEFIKEWEHIHSQTFVEIEKPFIPEYLQISKDGNNFTFEKILADTPLYTRYQISYLSEWFKISWVMNIPKNAPHAPVIILNHWYIDTSIYTLGRWLKREQDYFASNGFAVIHTDYRNHAFSDNDKSLQGTGTILRSKKYGADAINAIIAVQKSKSEGVEILSSVDTSSVWMLWHSMGWWVTMYSLVATNNIIKAAVLYAPIHSNEYYNYKRWSSNRLSLSEKKILTSQLWSLENPANFIPISPQWYFKNITAPVQIYFGTLDQSCPVSWGTDIKDELKKENKQVELIIYEWESHEFISKWNEFMYSSARFFRENLKEEKTDIKETIQ